MLEDRVCICVPSPRDIPEFTQSLTELPWDKYLVKYQPQVQAYNKIREFFLSDFARARYDTMVLFADDLIVHKKGLESLILQAHGGFAGQWVISGICNFDMWMNVDKYCFKPRTTWYSGEFPPINLAGYVQKHKEALLFQELNLMRVTFNGFACMVVPRWIVEAIPFRYDNEGGAGVDQNFCDDVRELDAGFGSRVELLIDLNVRFIHLAQRTMDGKLECSGLGIKKPQELFIHGLEVKEMIYQL